jgi:RimJ/RimL family protein N-acetyltransferase
MVSIVKATVDDAEALLKIKINAFAWDLETYGMGPPDYDSLPDLISSINRAKYYKIIYDDKIAGGLSLYDMGENHFELGGLYIEPGLHNRGIGQEVIKLAEQEYPEITKWTLDTPYLSFRNQHVYEKMGYVKVGEYKPFEDKDFILFRYEKNI